MTCERCCGITSSLLVPASPRLTSEAFTNRWDVSFVAYATPPRGGQALTPSGVLPSFCSRHPRIPPIAGNPFRPAGGLRAVIPRLPRLPPSVDAFASIENILVSHGDTRMFSSRLRDCCGRGCPRPKGWSGMRGFAPHSKTGRWGALNPLGRIFFGGSPVQIDARLGAHLLEAATRRHGYAVPLSLPHAQFRCMSRFAHQSEIGAAPN